MDVLKKSKGSSVPRNGRSRKKRAGRHTRPRLRVPGYRTGDKERPLKIHFAPADEGGTSFHWMRIPAKIINDTGVAEAVVDRLFDMESNVLILQRQNNPALVQTVKFYQKKGGVVFYWIEDQTWLLPFTSPVHREYSPTVQANMGKIIAACDGVTVSSQPLADFLTRYNKNVHVLPHMMLSEWATRYTPTVPRTDDTIRILWTTTAHHHHDFGIVDHALKDICNKYPNVRVILWGYTTQRAVEMLPRGQLEYYGWVPIDQYYKCLASMEADIGIAPLEGDSVYNRAKTPLKFVEYGLMGIAPIVSDVLPYDCVVNGETGLKVTKNAHKGWVEALCKLVEDASLRKKLAENARDYVVANHTESNIEGFIRVYKDTFNEKRKKEEDPADQKSSSKKDTGE